MKKRYGYDPNSKSYHHFEEQMLRVASTKELEKCILNAVHEIREAPASFQPYPFRDFDIRIRRTTSMPELLIAYGLSATFLEEYPDDDCWEIVFLLVRYSAEIEIDDEPEPIATEPYQGVLAHIEGRDHAPVSR